MTTKTTTTTNEPTAAESYARNRSDIARLLDVMEMELDKHGQRAADDAKNYGFAGDLGKVRGDLVNLVAFLSRMDAAEVDRFLDEAI